MAQCHVSCHGSKGENITLFRRHVRLDTTLDTRFNEITFRSKPMSTTTDESMREAALRLFLEEETKRKTDPEETHERSIIVIGSKEVGKTTMIHRFLEKDEIPKPTIAMDYSFGRKAGKSLIKDIVHVWEVGHLASSLLSAAMTGSALTHSPNHVTLLIMVDLAKPEVLWSSLEECLTVARSALKMSYDEKTIDRMKEMRRKVEDKEVDPFPLRLCIVGGKYDVFKDFDLNRKQLIGQTLRAVAHSLGAALQYHSCKDTILVRRIKDMLSHYGFGAQPMRGVCTDYEKALVVPAGVDSFAQINLIFPQRRPASILDTIKQLYETRIPQDSKENESSFEDPANDPNFQEPIIDRLRAQREEEISVLLQDMLEGRTLNILVPDPF